MNLEEYAAQHEVKCPLCGIAEQAEVEAAWKRGVGPTLIARWLTEIRGHDALAITARRVRNHFESRHQPA